MIAFVSRCEEPGAIPQGAEQIDVRRRDAAQNVIGKLSPENDPMMGELSDQSESYIEIRGTRKP